MVSDGRDLPWWATAVFYHIYPRSFQDSDGDGIGDLDGIHRRLDYLSWLGVDAVWLSPVYRSPMDDFGYDIVDHCDIDPIFGDLARFDALLAAAHDRGIRVVLDYVPHHTSVQHRWFIESAAGRDSSRRDWYIWRDPRPGGGPPNNWRRNGHTDIPGSAWTFDPETGQYYLATFSAAQPDVNWANPQVRAAMVDVARFWLDRGVDGFRVDMADFLGKDPHFRDEPEQEPGAHYFSQTRHQLDQSLTLAYLREIRDLLDTYPGRVLAGELAYLTPVADLARYSGTTTALLDVPLNFRLIMLPFTAPAIGSFVESYERALADTTQRDCAVPAWPNYCLGNHDNPRITRHGEDAARLAALLLLTLRGTPILYYGDEIAIPDIVIPAEHRRDPHPTLESPHGRDSSRTPMQWSNEAHAGFSATEPWLPIATTRHGSTVAAQQAAPDSMLTLYRTILALRRESPALSRGTLTMGRHDDDVLLFERCADTDVVVVALNLGTRTRRTHLPGAGDTYRVLLSTEQRDATTAATTVVLQPWEGILLQRDSAANGVSGSTRRA